MATLYLAATGAVHIVLEGRMYTNPPRSLLAGRDVCEAWILKFYEQVEIAISIRQQVPMTLE